MFSLLLIISLLSYDTSAIEPKLNVDILYESLCPDCLEFIVQQLKPAWPEIGDYVNLKLVPFGKSESIAGGADFVCQHGPKECAGNRLQSCALVNLQNQTNQVDFVYCFMLNYQYTPENVAECMKRNGLDTEEVLNCYNSNLGVNLQLIAEEYTKSISPTFIPTILYNGIFDQKLQDASLINFREVVCQFITQIHKNACSNPAVLHI